jgi:hypothetical protein
MDGEGTRWEPKGWFHMHKERDEKIRDVTAIFK